ncbi:hypothetical protein Hanom_Chr06g00514361 [Helianthus anomalus]
MSSLLASLLLLVDPFLVMISEFQVHIQPCYSTKMSSSLNMNTSGSGVGCEMALADLREGSTGPIKHRLCRQ